MKQSNLRAFSLLLAVLQIVCLLALPVCAERMLDTGVRRGGLTSCVPEALREQTMNDLRLFMPPQDFKTVSEAYTLENGVYTLSGDADRAALEAILPVPEVRYLRLSQQGRNAMAAARTALESGAMTQSDLIAQAEQSAATDALTPRQLKTAAMAFLKSESSVLGTDTARVRNGYLWRVSVLLLLFAVLGFGCAALRGRLHLPEEKRLHQLLMTIGAAIVIAIFAAQLIAEGGLLPGAWCACILALAQALLVWLPAELPDRALPEAASGKEKLLAALPSVLAAAAALLFVSMLWALSDLTTGLQKLLSAKLSAGSGRVYETMLEALAEGGLLVLSAALAVLARIAAKRQKAVLPASWQSVWRLLGSIFMMTAALVGLSSLRFGLAVIVLLSLGLAVLVYVRLLNNLDRVRVPLIRLIGNVACVCVAGFAAAFAGRGTLTLGGAAACMVCALLFTNRQSAILTRH